jgi:hypothetical protein
MASLLIRDIHREAHSWLRREAERNRRSMAQQAIVAIQGRMWRFHPVYYKLSGVLIFNRCILRDFSPLYFHISLK